jgi:DNA-binding NtrC family response regulator
LSSHAWPGNYDELSKFIRQAEQALRLEQGTVLGGQLTRRLLADADWISLPKLVDKLEAQIIAEALRRFDGNHAAAARVLKMTPRQITYKCDKYGLE